MCQISSFTKVWSALQGGPGNSGATFFEPSQLPEEFSVLGHYAQPNNKPLFGWVLAGKDATTDSSHSALKLPIDYGLVWSSNALKIKQDSHGYIWLPIPPDGYKAIGYLVTNSPLKPSLDKIRCVRSDFTDICQKHKWIWGPEKKLNPKKLNVYSLTPVHRGIKELAVPTGTFLVQNNENDSTPQALACLKNANANYLSSMPNLNQIQALVQAYSPYIYFHPSEKYFPSSVTWFFKNGAKLCRQGEESNPVPIEPSGSNLPQGGADDGTFWLDLPADRAAKSHGKSGDLHEAEVYLHIKPMLGATFTDIAIWLFFPFNGPGKAKIWGIVTFPLGKIGQHIGDWEHLTLRISNFNGELRSVYLSQHSRGIWISASELEFEDGNRPAIYASLHGHALFPRAAGGRLQGKIGIGVENDTSGSEMVMDTAERCVIVAAAYLGEAVAEPPWLNYCRKWGPEIRYFDCLGMRGALRKTRIPKEVFGEEGPVGPNMKGN